MDGILALRAKAARVFPNWSSGWAEGVSGLTGSHVPSALCTHVAWMRGRWGAPEVAGSIRAPLGCPARPKRQRAPGRSEQLPCPMRQLNAGLCGGERPSRILTSL